MMLDVATQVALSTRKLTLAYDGNVITQWMWNYLTRSQGARLITGLGVLPPIPLAQDDDAANGAASSSESPEMVAAAQPSEG